MSISLTAVAHFSSSKSCENLLSEVDSARSQPENTVQADIVKFREHIVGFRRMNQRRPITEAGLPGLFEAMEAASAGTTIVDMGAGYGVTIASAVLGTNLGGHDIDGGREEIDILRDKFKHLKFLGITATPAEDMVVPLVGPDGRWHFMNGRLLEDIGDDEIKAYLDDKPVLAFSLMGVFEYTPTPDLALKKFHTAFPKGSRLFLGRHGGTASWFQTSEGKTLDMGEYAESSGFRVIRMIHYQYRSQPWLPYTDKTAVGREDDPVVQAAMKVDSFGIAGWIIENTQTFVEHPVQIVANWGARPPTYAFRFQDKNRTDLEKKRLDELLKKSDQTNTIPYNVEPRP